MCGAGLTLRDGNREYFYQEIELFGVEHYFDEILGISNIYAKSKIAVGMAYINCADIGRTVLIGDTVHDYEVAEALCIDCILVSNGHQSKSTLLSRGVPVVDNIMSVMEIV